MIKIRRRQKPHRHQVRHHRHLRQRYQDQDRQAKDRVRVSLQFHVSFIDLYIILLIRSSSDSYMFSQDIFSLGFDVKSSKYMIR